MHKIFLIFLFTTLFNIEPLFSQSNNFNFSVNSAFNTKNSLGFYNNLRTQHKSNINFNLGYTQRNLSSQLSFNFDDKKFNFDNSYIKYKKGIADFNIGRINRNWSFSEKSSLILSSNSRPIEAISINLEKKFNTKWLSPFAYWSIEMINGSTQSSFNNRQSMLSGTRFIISPSKKLKFEFIQTGQWGDQNDKLYSQNFDALFFGNTNEGVNSHLNKMAGFGLSYTLPLNKDTYRFYSQAIGEDEAGNLPSCYAWMLGLEVTAPKMKFPTTLTIEAIDTRVKTSTHGNCGPNTMYQNNVYNYINYNTVLGVPIDTEGTSLEVFGQSQINKNLSVNYSSKFLSINDKDFSGHRLSSKRSLGTISSLGIHWKKESFDFGGSISYQNLTLNKTNISNNTIFSLYSSIEF